MEIRLTRNQLLETLREMGVHYPADADEETLKQILERENSARWLERAQRAREEGRSVIRKRRSEPAPSDESPGEEPEPRRLKPESGSGRRHPERKDRPAGVTEHRGAKSPVEESDLPAAPPVHSPTFNPVRDVDALVLIRAAGVCELCEMPESDNRRGTPAGLTPVFIDPLQDGTTKTLKNVAALCPDCMARLKNGLDLADAKKLRTMARRKVISNVVISTRPKGYRSRRRKR